MHIRERRIKAVPSILLAAVITCAGILAAPPANASTLTSTDQIVLEWYLDNGVTDATARDLIDKFNSGQLVDSMTATDPVSVVESDEDGWLVSRAYFADGSVSVTRMETPSASAGTPGGMATQGASVGGCASVQGGSGYANYYDCAVYGSNGAYLDISFRADYTRTSAGTGVINRVGSPYQYAIGGKATTPVLSIITRSGNPAKARATSQYSSATNSFTAYLNLYVNGSRAWADQNF